MRAGRVARAAGFRSSMGVSVLIRERGFTADVALSGKVRDGMPSLRGRLKWGGVGDTMVGLVVGLSVMWMGAASVLPVGGGSGFACGNAPARVLMDVVTAVLP